MNENQFFASVKLTTGEEILGLIEIQEDGILIENVLIIEDMSIFDDVLESVSSKGLKLSKWIKSSTENIFFIRDDKIITIGELKEPVLTSYKRAVVDITRGNENLHKQNVQKENRRKKYSGHHSKVKDARIKFEQLFNDY
jgi:hypothetical protein